MTGMKRYICVGVIGLIGILWLSLPVYSQEEGFQGWEGKTFTRNSFDEDIKDVLKAVAKIGDTPITFGEDITDTITMDFKKMPLKKAFRSLVARYGMAYYWDADAIHVYKTDTAETKDVLIRLENLQMDEAKRAISRFGLLKKEIKFVFDEQSNTILLTGTERQVKNVEEVIAVLEEAKKKQVEIKPGIRYYTIHYARVADTIITIGKKTVTVKGLETILTKVLQLTRKKAEMEVVAKTGAKGEAGTPEEKIAGEQESRARAIKSMIKAEAGSIFSDPRTNQIIIRDYPDKLDEYAEIIRKLDKPMKMVNVDIMVVQASKGFAREFGISYAGARNRTAGHDAPYWGTSQAAKEVLGEAIEQTNVILKDASDATQATGEVSEKVVPIASQLTTNNLIPLLGAAGGSQITPYGLAGTYLFTGNKSTLLASIAAAETKGVSKTIHKSSVLTMDNMKAIVESKNIVTYKIQTGGDNPTVESKQIEAGIELTITPHIIKGESEKPMVELIVETERSSLNRANRTDGIPEKLSTKLNTQAIIIDGATVVLGGMFDNDYARGETGIPCLMSVPLLGNLFKTASARNPKSNILFFMTPQIIALDQIPYDGSEYREKIKKHEDMLRQIDSDNRKKLIEKFQD